MAVHYTQDVRSATAQAREDVVIDCALYTQIPAISSLFPYLPAWWQDYSAETGFAGPEHMGYPGDSPLILRPEAMAATAEGHELATQCTGLLDAWGISHAILHCPYNVASLHNEDLAAALAGAANAWLQAEWLARDARLRASLLVPAQNADLAAAEIERHGDDRRFVQVLLPLLAEAPLGKRRYWPIYEAAQRHGLAIGIYDGGAGVAGSPLGLPTFALEEYADRAVAFQSQVLSLVAEGVFVQFPALRVVLIGSGCTWLPSLLWRFDKNWRGLRREVPWLAEPPSHAIRRHIRLTLQPFDAPAGSASLLQFVDHCRSDELLLFSGEYPYWHGEPPERVLPADLPAVLRTKILAENARAVYRL
jgi:predicted TIM-barrel fold metal-dependent hydrolase